MALTAGLPQNVEDEAQGSLRSFERQRPKVGEMRWEHREEASSRRQMPTVQPKASSFPRSPSCRLFLMLSTLTAQLRIPTLPFTYLQSLLLFFLDPPSDALPVYLCQSLTWLTSMAD
jgi:hypothetical protein